MINDQGLKDYNSKQRQRFKQSTNRPVRDLTKTVWDIGKRKEESGIRSQTSVR